MTMPPRPFSAAQLAERWQCSAETVRQLVKCGQLSGFRIGRMIRIPRAAVEEYEAKFIATPEENATVDPAQDEPYTIEYVAGRRRKRAI
ncbi:helix-turn-helix domain-containing protein [Phaeobacter inhibens]|uniref:helix-turn-helix domain-containing protein n=1 Tax=Phaeobacter inhibens TaxID=221822 RepID=UPI000C9D1E59|nr:DNA binding domain, excisionase family [Phaeobacter inhibens]AUQ77199.1 DNA binding domain, excisionase family [Phaeobacter inhibens]AUR14358.1 DNA binding domain, excisionase family [Phaeobacter inhibens]